MPSTQASATPLLIGWKMANRPARMPTIAVRISSPRDEPSAGRNAITPATMPSIRA